MNGSTQTFVRRSVLVGGAKVGAGLAGAAHAQEPTRSIDTPAPPLATNRGSNLMGKVAVVTGAARGIGRAIAVDMAANGADVAILDICGAVSPASDAKPAQFSELHETEKLIQSHDRKCISMQADIRDIATLRSIADRVEREWGKIDIVVANAAIQRWTPLLEMQDADWFDVINNNLNGTANTIRAFAPKLVARNYGRIIVLSSMQGKHGTKDASSYSASKWGILGLMKSAAMELGRHNITVNAVIPGCSNFRFFPNGKNPFNGGATTPFCKFNQALADNHRRHVRDDSRVDKYAHCGLQSMPCSA